jgi:integrase
VFSISPTTTVYPQHRQWLDEWYAAVKAADLGLDQRPRIHDLRHGHASICIAGGMNLFELAARLGHASILTTTNTYGHLAPDVSFRNAALVERVMGVVEA